ncbi:hypothetical protein [Pseudoalteromonas luteoviolacea]|nr:hypothetical protein [Pseudoalteromonas luteoviolacea]KZN52812.1 hypothetical protein N474_22320 [Pseudoalteromonas luteoviolacea CPMOR-2]
MKLKLKLKKTKLRELQAKDILRDDQTKKIGGGWSNSGCFLDDPCKHY